MEWLSLQQFGLGYCYASKGVCRYIKNSKGGEKSYRAISVVCQYSFHLRSLFAVSKKSFYPMPLVESVVLVVVLRNNTPRLTEPIIKNVNMIFSQRNRKVWVLNKKFRLNRIPLDIKIDHLDFD